MALAPSSITLSFQIQNLPFFHSSYSNSTNPTSKPLKFKLCSFNSHSHSPLTLQHTGRFLTNQELLNLNSLETFLYSQDLQSGPMWVRVMRAHEMDPTVRLLADSFADSMLLPSAYTNVLRYLVKQYLIERTTLMPHVATLLAFYREFPNQQVHLAGTVEVCFDTRGSSVSVPSPTPPKDSPYICNMAVHKSLRRRGIGWHLLKASEELISQISSSREVYLHCRIIDEAPFKMYTKAEYEVVKTDSILVLLMLQRRKHLMCKKLPLLSTPSETDLPVSDF